MVRVRKVILATSFITVEEKMATWSVNLRKLARKTLFLILTPLALVFRALGWRSLRPGVEARIGHLITEPFIAQHNREVGSWKWNLLVIPYSERKSANFAVQKRLSVSEALWITNSLLGKLLKPFTMHPKLLLNTNEEISISPASVFRYSRNFGSHGYFQRRDSDESDLRAALRNLGLTHTKHYVVLHVRERGYILDDDDLQSHRNGDLLPLRSAVDWLNQNGIQVIRIGGPYGEPTSEMLPSVVDYAFSEHRDELTDILLCQGCYFFLGNTSGIHALATVQNRPSLGINMSPLGAFGMLGSRTMSIPKLLWSCELERYLRFEEVFNSPVGNTFDPAVMQSHGIAPHQNTELEILEATQDMVKALEASDWGEMMLLNPLQNQFRQLVPSNAYSYYCETVIAPSFLRRHQSLLSSWGNDD